MPNQPDFKMQLICALRSRDVELAEDLYRRMNSCNTVAQLNLFFHSTLAQYPSDTMDLRSKLVITEDFDVWFNTFITTVYPFIAKKRLPPCTHLEAQPMYTCRSKSL